MSDSAGVNKGMKTPGCITKWCLLSSSSQCHGCSIIHIHHGRWKRHNTFDHVDHSKIPSRLLGVSWRGNSCRLILMGFICFAHRMIERYKKWLAASEKSSMHGSGVGKSFLGICSWVLCLLTGIGGWLYDGILFRFSKDVDAKTSNGGGSMRFDEDPGFPLFPVSKGFSITLKKTLEAFEKRTSAMTVCTKCSSHAQLLESPSSPNIESTSASDVVPESNLTST